MIGQTPPPRSPSPPGSLNIENHQSAPILVRIDGATVVEVGCNERARLTPDETDVPPLPWNLTVDGGDGFFERTVEALPRWYVQFLDGHGALFAEPVTVSGLEWARCPPPSPGIEQPSACCSGGPIPSPVAGETRRESEAFWRHWHAYPFDGLVYQADSLEENFDQSHLVIRGHISDVYVGEYWNGTTPVAYVRLAVAEVFKGAPASRTEGYVEVQLGRTSEETVEKLRDALPQHDNLWFLLHVETVRPREVPNQSDIAPFAYMRVNQLQGVVRNIDGRARVVRPQAFKVNPYLGVELFPRPLEGTSFADLVNAVRLLAE